MAINATDVPFCEIEQLARKSQQEQDARAPKRAADSVALNSLTAEEVARLSPQQYEELVSPGSTLQKFKGASLGIVRSIRVRISALKKQAAADEARLLLSEKVVAAYAGLEARRADVVAACTMLHAKLLSYSTDRALISLTHQLDMDAGRLFALCSELATIRFIADNSKTILGQFIKAKVADFNSIWQGFMLNYGDLASHLKLADLSKGLEEEIRAQCQG